MNFKKMRVISILSQWNAEDFSDLAVSGAVALWFPELMAGFGDRFDERCIVSYARYKSQLYNEEQGAREGKPTPLRDALLAATAEFNIAEFDRDEDQEIIGDRFIGIVLEQAGLGHLRKPCKPHLVPSTVQK